MTRAVLLAAGRGSRLAPYTDDRPKCMVEVDGRPMLEWQLDSLAAAGVTDTTIVTGYRADALERYGKRRVHNPRWDESNMVVSLIQVADQLAAATHVVAYTDILYAADHVRALMDSPHDITLTADTRWAELWSARWDNPLDDAETFATAGGLLTDIGGRPASMNEAPAQFMGLMRLTPTGWAQLLTVVEACPPEAVDSLDTTALLRRALDAGVSVGAVEVAGRWCEIDDHDDLTVVAGHLNDDPPWSHDWR